VKKLFCPDCWKYFYLPIAKWLMLQESMRRNPKLKIICPQCGEKEHYRVMAEREAAL
jgi:RNase P subunit RPR2